MNDQQLSPAAVGLVGAQITFAIPFYGSPDFMQSALLSVVRQSRPDWEAFVVDDCSPHDAEAIVRGLDDPRIHYVRNAQNLGLAGNWNRCLQLGSAPLITLLHGDDELAPGYAELMVQAHRRHPGAAAIFCEADIIDAQGQRRFSFRDLVKKWLVGRREGDLRVHGESGFESLLRGNFIMCPTLCYRRQAVAEHAFSARWRMVLDVDFYLRLLLTGATLIGVNQVAYRYRRHDEQMTAQCERDLRLFTEEIELWQEAAAAAERQGWLSAARTARRMRFVRLHLLYYIGLDLARGEIAAARRKLQMLRGMDVAPA